MAIENASEGCVRETFGALLATWQARNAADPTVRGSMRRIARDETRHAALAWSVARWADRKLSSRDRRRALESQRAAVSALAREVAVDPPSHLVSGAGLPSSASARCLVGVLKAELWS
jgi:hypothetical protein